MTPEAPFASRITVSLVDMQPSESVRSKVTRVAVAQRAGRPGRAVRSASVVEHDEHRGQRRGQHARALRHAADRPAGLEVVAACLRPCRWS